MEAKELRVPAHAKKTPELLHPLLVEKNVTEAQDVSFTYTALAALAPAVLLGLIMVIASSVAFNV